MSFNVNEFFIQDSDVQTQISDLQEVEIKKDHKKPT